MTAFILPSLLPSPPRRADIQARTLISDADTDAGERGLSLRLNGVGKRFGDRRVLHDLGLEIPAGQFVAVVGRSGCGKSTLLRLLAGLDGPSEGSVALNHGGTAAEREDVRIMYQDSRLLPWRSVVENVALGLPGARRRALAEAREALAHVGLADRAGDWPDTLSGGQRQRVALARALAHRPRLLLLDEPLGALDALTRIEMHALIERIWREEGFTALLVTHDVTEAVVLADRVVLIEDGAIVLDEAIPLSRPRDRSHADFVRLEATVLNRILA
jgi:sulfonate transport system ATP-binding protein